jgi:hypothetical protein
MRARIAVMLACLVASSAAEAAGPLMPTEIQSTFFNGMPFNAAAPSGVKFKMTFTADGKARRVPAGKGGTKNEGAWKLDDNGYCITWKGGKPACYTVVASDKSKWSVMKGSTVMATWSK